MKNQTPDLTINGIPIRMNPVPVEGGYVEMLGEHYYRIGNYDQMPPFFMSLVSSADHWLFIASTGGLTAGRANANSALFPYETEDKVTAHSEYTGSKTIIRVTRNGKTYLWEPFSERYAGIYHCERHLYKNIHANKLIFEEINHDLQLTLRAAWRTGDRFGFIRDCRLINNDLSDCQIELVDGLQNLLPCGATNAMQNALSSLLNAYKRNEIEPLTGLGIFTLSATLTDRAEPSESLRATVAWQVGLDNVRHLLSADQLDAFRRGGALIPDYDLRGKAGAYFANASFELPSKQEKHWYIVADVNQDSAAVAKLSHLLRQEKAVIEAQIEADIDRGTAELIRFVAAADGLQLSAQETTTAHHYANVLFNIMRGGIFINGYQVERDDLLDFVQVRNRSVLAKYADWFADLPAQFSIQELYSRAAACGEPDLVRLCYEYMPLTFSRRHGDPSRPWNSFSINLKHPDGSPRLDYQGNWRDIFQNWEPLALAFPAYVEGMIAKFLNAITLDGYNPYRVTRDGIEWEIPEPGNPWSNIGYWNDHQIIYLQKLLEIAEHAYPGRLAKLWNQPVFAYADVPYRLHPYTEMLKDWYNTIDFDWASEQATEAAVAEIGTDGRLRRDQAGKVIHVTMAEKLLVLLLAKLTNLVPEGGIWMNTQRPEWNDANNALVGKGLSVVTVAYLRRFIAFWQGQLASTREDSFPVNTAVGILFAEVQRILEAYHPHLETAFDERTRRAFMDSLGSAATAYRSAIYSRGIPATEVSINASNLRQFLAIAQDYVTQTLRANLRPDGLTHTYNILRLGPESATVEHLYLMLEGQVALLSSGLLSAAEALKMLRSLRDSELYRPDQHSYMLYPNRDLPGFQQKNNVAAEQIAQSELVAALTAAGDRRLLIRDQAGVYHFNGRFRNANDAAAVLDDLAQEPDYAEWAGTERGFILDLFETTFNHRAFTGRSGTFFAFEGLGSIYWHMVSKLLLAVQECYQQALDVGEDGATIEALADFYYDIRSGIGFNKSPEAYGAFPTDPYSHTPMGSGARQPGMTGLVKEEILTRWGELGVSLRHGALCFMPTLLRTDEFLQGESSLNYVNVMGDAHTLSLSPGYLAFTFCQVPVLYQRGGASQIEIVYESGDSVTLPSDCLDGEMTQHIFNHDGQIRQLNVTLPK